MTKRSSVTWQQKNLAQNGFEVETCDNGTDTMEWYRRSKEMGNPFQAVLMDLTVQGGMGGEEATSHLKKIDPDVKAIVSNGYHNVSIVGNYRQHGFC